MMKRKDAKKIAISPWDTDACRPSPDGRFMAELLGAVEIRMGSPTSGTLKLSTGMRLERSNPSYVWSDDSRLLAVPQWTEDLRQRLVIVNVERGKMRAAEPTFAVLELHTFRKGVLEGVDSPVHHPIPVRIDLGGWNWDD